MPASKRVRRVLWAFVLALGMPILYLLVTFWQVRSHGGRDEARQADAIIVLGAAQFDGRPSPVLAARLDHGLDLWKQGLAPIIVVTGGKQPGDRVTEATASADYLLKRGVPDAVIRREVDGETTYASIAASARFLKAEGRHRVLVVSEPYHMLRTKGIGKEVGLAPFGSPTSNSPERHVFEHELKETLGVAVARFIGYRRLVRLTG